MIVEYLLISFIWFLPVIFSFLFHFLNRTELNKKNEKKGGQSKDPLDNIKYTKIHFTGIREREEREKRPEKYLKR